MVKNTTSGFGGLNYLIYELPYGLDELYLRRVGAQLLGLELMSDHTPDYVIGSQSALSKISRLAEASLLISHWPANERQGNIEIS